MPLLEDQDTRVIPAAIGALVKLRAPDLDAVLLKALSQPDFGVRLAAAQAIGELEARGRRGRASRGLPRRSGRFDIRSSRRRARRAQPTTAPAEATETLKAALADKDWPLQDSRRPAAREARSVDRRRARHPAGAVSRRRSVQFSRAPVAAVFAARLHRDREGHDRDRADGAGCAADDAELHGAGAEGLLQRPADSTASCRTSSCRTATRAGTAKADRATRSATS